tara:strand:- start:14 stop:361 length:348 start_codon:yes stop_codon:yes gene_type:complete
MGSDDSMSIEDFKAVIAENNGCVLMKFSADWCGPCKKIAPYIQEKIANLGNKGLQYLEIDIDESCDLFIYLKKKKMVTKVPTFLLYKGNNQSEFCDFSVIGTDVGEIDAMFKMIE